MKKILLFIWEIVSFVAIILWIPVGLWGFYYYMANPEIGTTSKPAIIPLFSCYELHGTKCTVTSNKENPCSYKVLICKTPTGEVVHRSEKYPTYIK